jgi:hypothetical protein
MADRATLEDIKYSGLEAAPVDKTYLNPAAGGLSQFGENPLAKIDTQALKKANDVLKSEKKITSKQHWVRKLFLQYVERYGKKWSALENYPKQIRQKPAWFDLALGLFKDSEISADDKKRIKEAFNVLWEYRDRSLPERVMSEEEANRQYGTKSPYYIQPEEAPLEQIEPSDELYSGDTQTPQEYIEPIIPQTDQEPISQPEENDFGVRKIVPVGSGDTYLSRYIIPARKTIDVTTAANPAMKPPQGTFTMGITQTQKESGGSGSGAFSIGKNMFAGLRAADSLKGVMNQPKPNLPVQPVQVKPNETITVAQQPEMMQRKQKRSLPSVNRNVKDISIEIKRTRSIELPKISKQEMPKISTKNKSKGMDLSFGKNKSMLDLDLGAISLGKKKSGKKSKKQSYGTIKSGKINTSFKVDKGNINTMSRDIKGSVGGVVGGINKLKKQVRGEFKGENIKSLNLKNIKAKKFTDHKDLNVLKKLKSETHSQISREALECKMIPKLREQCDRVFTKNHVTNEVSKFRHEFKDIGKMVPTVRGDKAKLTEVSMLGNSITHGVDGAQVADVRAMYKNSGSTKQMSIGRMEYDYSFVTGKKRPKPTMFTEDEEEEY